MTQRRRPMLTVVPRRTHTALTVVFGPSRSRFFERALAHARAAAGELTELSPGRFQAEFTLRSDPSTFAHVAALSALVRHWRGTEFSADGLPVRGALVQLMAWCAADQLARHGACQLLTWGPPAARSRLCPLFDPGAAERRLAGLRVADRLRQRSPGPLPGRGSQAAGADRPGLRLVRMGEEAPRTALRFTVVFGPSRSWDFQRALARAKDGATEVTEEPDGSVRAEFVLGDDPRPYLALEAICRLLMQLRGTEVMRDGVPVAAGAAAMTSRRARQLLHPRYTVPPPRDLVSLLVDDLTDDGDDETDFTG